MPVLNRHPEEGTTDGSPKEIHCAHGKFIMAARFSRTILNDGNGLEARSSVNIIIPWENSTNSLLLNMDKGGYVYILTNKHNTTLYTGVTSDLRGRLWDHKTKFYPKSFSARYNLNKLIYFDVYAAIEDAIAMEKYIKGKSRAYKEKLIEKTNPEWADLGIEVEEW